MKKNEYLDQLRSELKKNNVTEMEEILCEYEQHFAFKLADGFAEEEIAAKLGSPKTIASQFDGMSESTKNNVGSNLILKVGLFFAAIFEAMFYMLFFAWDVVLGASAIAFGAVGVCLIGNFNFEGLIPYMPYSGALILGISIMGLVVLIAVAAFYCFEFLKQMIRASIRWHKNVLSPSVLPPLPWSPQFEAKTKRRLRAVMLWSLAVFGACFILACVVMMMQAGAMGFWHEWNWFV